MNLRILRASGYAIVVLCLSTPVLAQRQLHWDSIDVEATLDATGTLHVAETQTMVFTGAWNGGERTFDVRPRQTLSMLGISRLYPGGWRALTEDDSLDDVDDYTWADGRLLRWRSRDPDDPPFEATSIRYLLRYTMSGVLLKDETGYQLNHDFLFPEREGHVSRFQLRLTLDPVWQPPSGTPGVYSGDAIAPGHGFVVTLPLQYSGAAAPDAIESNRPQWVVPAVGVLLLSLGVGLAFFFMREARVGRFAPLDTNIDESWLREHVLRYPAEIVGAAWDEGISTPEVVALIARLVSEGKLASAVGKRGSMTLDLKVDRETLSGHERTLVDRLFFGGRTQTSTKQVRQHYKRQGFNPADEIRKELRAAVEGVVPNGPNPPRLRVAMWALFLAGIALLAADFYVVRLELGPAIVVVLGSAFLMGFAAGTGQAFRSQIHWGHRGAWACLSPTLVAFTIAVAFLWFRVRPGLAEVSDYFVAAVVSFALAVLMTSINAMMSRQHVAAVAFRKRLAAGRAFFSAELAKDRPALRDEWLPWILAFGLARRMDDWSARQPGSGASAYSSSAGTFSSSAGSSPASWTGFSGGRAGGAGGGAAWVTAASGMAAPVSTPGSSSSSGGGSSSSSGGSSSGGGGGGGW
jgi:hypothetical protein